MPNQSPVLSVPSLYQGKIKREGRGEKTCSSREPAKQEVRPHIHVENVKTAAASPESNYNGAHKILEQTVTPKTTETKYSADSRLAESDHKPVLAGETLKPVNCLAKTVATETPLIKTFTHETSETKNSAANTPTESDHKPVLAGEALKPVDCSAKTVAPETPLIDTEMKYSTATRPAESDHKPVLAGEKNETRAMLHRGDPLSKKGHNRGCGHRDLLHKPPWRFSHCNRKSGTDKTT